MGIIDEIFSNGKHPNKLLYLEIKKRIFQLNSDDPKIKFSDMLYVGGKKGKGKTGYGRQMILADLIEYIFFGRGHYYVANDPQRKKVFIELILYTINLLILIESLSVQSELRKNLLKKLPIEIGNSFFKESDMKKFHKALLLHDGDIGWNDMKIKKFKKSVIDILKTTSGTSANWKKLNSYYDSLLPKTGGGLWNELIVFFYLIRRTAVYIIPLLLIQRILSKENELKPPDFLVYDKDGKLFGIEVGEGKEGQSSDFTSLTGASIVTTENTNVPPRCPICGEFVVFCPKVIEDCIDIEENPLLRMSQEVHCIPECKKFSDDEKYCGKCPFIQYNGPVSKKTLKHFRIEKKYKKDYHYHYSCIKNLKDKTALKKIDEEYKKFKNNGREVSVLKTDYPYVRGSIDRFDKLEKNEIVCFGKYPNKDIKNCNVCDYTSDCETKTDLLKIIKSGSGLKEKRKKINKVLG